MSKELIERLRADAESTDDIGLCADAADRIEELESERDDFGDGLAQVKLKNAMLIKERDALQADRERLREAIRAWELATDTDELLFAEGEMICAMRDTPEQSLARLRNEVLEKAAKVCDRFAEREMHPAECAGALRAMKEPE